MRDFKIWCETDEELNMVLKKMDSDMILWTNFQKPSNFAEKYPAFVKAPIGLCCKDGFLTYKFPIEFANIDKDIPVVTPKQYLSVPLKEAIENKADVALLSDCERDRDEEERE